jgi:hypothetical protein
VARVRSESGEEGQLLRPDEDVDGVDLDDTDPLKDAAHVAAVDAAAGPRVDETLGGERDPARRRSTQTFRGRHSDSAMATE